MSRAFMYGKRLQEMEQMMMSVPNFSLRGKGLIITGTKMIGEKEEWEQCDACTEYVKGRCTVPHCPYMMERIGLGQIQYHHIVKVSFFKKRLRELVRSFVGEWHLSPFHKDRYSYVKEGSALFKNKRNERLAVLCILSADEEFWTRAKSHINRKHIELDKVNVEGIRTNGYALYQATRTIMTGKAHIEETTLADDNLIATYAFKVIINAFMIAWHSDEIMKVGK